jgi:hypothetical protein
LSFAINHLHDYVNAVTAKPAGSPRNCLNVDFSALIGAAASDV